MRPGKIRKANLRYFTVFPLTLFLYIYPMNIEQAHAYCLSRKAAEPSFPFGDTTLVFKVMNKIFALLPLDEVENPSINLKCDPDYALELRERHPEVKPGFHMNKKHWNTVMLEEDLTNDSIKAMIDHSYDLIVKSLPKKQQAELEAM